MRSGIRFPFQSPVVRRGFRAAAEPAESRAVPATAAVSKGRSQPISHRLTSARHLCAMQPMSYPAGIGTGPLCRTMCDTVQTVPASPNMLRLKFRDMRDRPRAYAGSRLPVVKNYRRMSHFHGGRLQVACQLLLSAKRPRPGVGTHPHAVLRHPLEFDYPGRHQARDAHAQQFGRPSTVTIRVVVSNSSRPRRTIGTRLPLRRSSALMRASSSASSNGFGR